MSFHYSANQYNEAFRANHLGNWQCRVTHPGVYPRRRTGTTRPIAFNNGHLFPGVRRNPHSSPWGDYAGWVWDSKGPCDSVDRIRNSQDYERPPCTIIVTTRRPDFLSEAKATSHALAKHLFQPA